MLKQLVILITASSLVTGCASMFSGTSQTITLRSDVPNTKFYLNGEELGTGSATTSVSKKNLSNTVFVAKATGCQDATTGIATKFDATTLLGVFIDLGIVSILVVDLGITGAAHEAERTNYILNPVCPRTAVK